MKRQNRRWSGLEVTIQDCWRIRERREEQAQGKFISHTQEEQIRIMQDYCSQYQTDTVVCYCHYCLEGLLLGNVNSQHIADLLFK